MKRAFLLSLLFACQPQSDIRAYQAGVPATPAHDDLLPNSTLYERGHDGSGYRVIAQWFQQQGYDVKPNFALADAAWPLTDGKTAVLSRFGTPILLANFWGYYHTAFDVIRTDVSESDTVVAPVDGLAMAFDWYGTPWQVFDDYATVVGIYDPASHLIVQLMHVKVAQTIASSTTPVMVKKGDPIGTLAMIPASVGDTTGRLRHTHVDFIDGEALRIVNPTHAFKTYKDSQAPGSKRFYLLDEQAAETPLKNGALDVVIEAFDRDDDSARNLEIAAIAFEIKDQSGAVLSSQPRCDLAHIYESVQTQYDVRALQLLDFGTAKGQLSGGWPNSDIDNPDRTFRYALTQLVVKEYPLAPTGPTGITGVTGETGVTGPTSYSRCEVLNDIDGFLQVNDLTQTIDVHVTLWDQNDNQSEHTATLAKP